MSIIPSSFKRIIKKINFQPCRPISHRLLPNRYQLNKNGKIMRKKIGKSGFTLLELTISLATIVIMLTATLTTLDSIRVERGLLVGAELRTLHLAQKNYLIQALDHPGTIHLETLTLAELQNQGLAPLKLSAIEKAGLSTIQVNVLPPICTLDGSQNDFVKTNKSTGDLLYDVGPE